MFPLGSCSRLLLSQQTYLSVASSTALKPWPGSGTGAPVNFATCRGRPRSLLPERIDHTRRSTPQWLPAPESGDPGPAFPISGGTRCALAVTAERGSSPIPLPAQHALIHSGQTEQPRSGPPSLAVMPGGSASRVSRRASSAGSTGRASRLTLPIRRAWRRASGPFRPELRPLRPTPWCGFNPDHTVRWRPPHERCPPQGHGANP